MKEKVYFYASLKENINELEKGTEVFTNLKECAFRKACELMCNQGIKPKWGILTNIGLGTKEYTLIERYDNHFEGLNCELYIYCILEKNTELEKNKIVDNVEVFNTKKIENLYEYLSEQRNFKLIDNDSKDKWWYNVPFDNGDIIVEYFKDVVNEEDNYKKKKMIMTLKKLFKDQIVVICKLEKLMFKMSKDEFLLFIDNIYDKYENKMNYDTFYNQKGDFRIGKLVKKLLRRK